MRKAKALEEKDINNPFIVVNNLFVLSPGPLLLLNKFLTNLFVKTSALQKN
jgi:hypothetical protein